MKYHIGRIMGQWAWIEHEDGKGGYLVPSDGAVAMVRELNAGSAELPLPVQLASKRHHERDIPTLLGLPIVETEDLPSEEAT